MPTTSHWQIMPDRPTREVDFLIVGAGIVGGAAAIFAAQAGRQVVVTEAGDIAQGASGRNAGFMITGLDAYYHHAVARYGADVVREMWALSKRTIAFWRGVIDRAGDVPYEQCGSLLLAESVAEARDLEQAARALDAAGFPVEYHATDPLGRGYHAAIAQADDGAVQPAALARAAIRLSGAELIVNNPVYDIVQTGPEQVTVYTRQAIFRARYVLLCVNAYAPVLDPFFEGRIIPTRANALVTEPLPERVLDTCGYSRYGYMYYRSTFDNRLLIGGGRDRYMDEEADTLEDRTNPRVQAVLDAYLKEYFPDVSAPVARRWAGIMGFSVDGLPQVGTLPGKPGVGYAVGFTGHGLSLGAGTAERAVDHLLTGADPGAVAGTRLD